MSQLQLKQAKVKLKIGMRVWKLRLLEIKLRAVN